MSIRRLRQRVASATVVGVATLLNHELKFHKVGRDGSAKCDIVETAAESSVVNGIVFDIDDAEKPELDRIEGLGCGYEEKSVRVIMNTEFNRRVGGYYESNCEENTTKETACRVTTYYATHINSSIKPFHWYKEHVLTGCIENNLPEYYIQTISSVESVVDPDLERHTRELAIYR